MRFALVLLMVLSALPQAADAAVVFTLSPPTSTIAQGTPAIFEVSVRSTLAGGEAVDGLEANVVSTAANSVFSAGTTFLLNNAAADLSVPREAFLSNFLVGGFNLGQNDTLFARLTLNTAAIAPGTYAIQLEDLAANGPTTGALAVQAGAPISFTITAVPEPSSMMLVGTVSCLFALRRRKR